MLLFSFTAEAGTWTRVDKTTLRFEGEIKTDEYKNYRAAIRRGDQVLIVDSLGGDVDAALPIGIDLSKRQMKVVVDGFCVSSCANYFFTAGKTKEIRKGYVGFHGNITALMKNSWEDTVKEFKKYKKSDKEIARHYKSGMALAAREQAFLKSVGVSQDLFDRTQSRDKGKGDGQTYSTLCPLPETFEKYGIKNITGAQDCAYKAKDDQPHTLVD